MSIQDPPTGAKVDTIPLRAVRRPSAVMGSGALGALALGALAMGALAIGSLAIGRLFVGRARFRRVEIGTLVVRRLQLPSHDG